jgi:hypothetical protein
MRSRWKSALHVAVPAAALVIGSAASQTLANGPVDAVTTPGTGDLTMCRSWIVYASCNTYHKVGLPPRVAIGDNIVVTFGSNPKDYNFHVARILHQDKTCKILSNASGSEGDGERIEVTQCGPAENAATQAH